MKANLSDNKWPISLLIIVRVITVFRFWTAVIYYNWFAGQEKFELLSCRFTKIILNSEIISDHNSHEKNLAKPKEF